MIDQIVSRIAKLEKKAKHAENTIFYATVTSVTPFRIRMDGDVDALPHSPASLVSDVHLNARVLVLRQTASIIVVGIVGGSCPHAVGDYYLTESATSPASRWPGTTWTALEGRMLVGRAASGTFTTIGDTGGAETHTLSVAEMPSHAHGLTITGGSTPSTNPQFIAGSEFTGGFSRGITTGGTGGGAAHNNMSPYRVCHIWRRTA